MFAKGEYAMKEIVQIGNLTFGICHGHQVVPHASKTGIAGLRRYVT